MCAGAGFDWVCIDGEHAPFDLRTILHNLQAIQSHDVPAIVRIPAADPCFNQAITGCRSAKHFGTDDRIR